MKGYCAKEDIENYTLTTIDSSFDDTISFWIETIEGFIDNETGRNFIADNVASKRYFDGNGEHNLFIDECVEISGLKIYNSLGDVVHELTKDTHYLEHPYNELPIRKVLSKLSNPIGFSRFYQGQKNIEVNAKWGYSVEVPAQIKFACMVLVAGIVNYSNNTEGEIKSEKIGDAYSVTYKDEQWQDYETAKEIIKSFTKIDV